MHGRSALGCAYYIRGKEEDKSWEPTQSDPVVPLGLLQEAVELPHLAHRSLCPPLGRGDRLDLLPEGLDVLRVGGEVVQRLRNALYPAMSRLKHVEVEPGAPLTTFV